MWGERSGQLPVTDIELLAGGEDDGSSCDTRMVIMVNFFEPGSLSVSDYEVYTLSDRGTINVRAVRQRFNIASAWLVDGSELEDDEAEVLAHLNIGNDLDITGAVLRGCSSGDEDGDAAPVSGRMCVLQ